MHVGGFFFNIIGLLMQKRIALCGVLLSVGSCFAFGEGAQEYEGFGYDPYSSMMMMGALSGRNQSFPEAFRNGVTLGITRGLSGITGKALEKGMSGAISGVTSTMGALKKAFLRSMFKNTGFDVRELLGWRDMLESSVNTHILNVAKGARVVRAHVLNQETEGKPESQTQSKPLHGICVLKDDMTYIVAQLDKYETFYTAKAEDVSRGVVNRVLDGAAIASALYVVGDCFVRRPNETACINEIEILQTQIQEQKDKGLTDKDLFLQLLVKRLAYAVDEYAHSSKANATHTKAVLKTGLSVFALVRLAQWLKSQEAIKAVTAFSQNNRDFIVHLVGSLRNNLKHLIALCDTIKEEGDLVRVKDDFEFISKNCRDVLLQMAYLIDQNESVAIQRIGKSGQTTMQQGLGGFGGLPKI